MEFNHFLSSYYPDTSYGADRHYADMLEQAVAAERLGYASVSIPEHHLMNILMNPAPLQMAFKVAGSMAMKKGALEASPALLEPLMKVECVTPEEYMGDVVGDLNRRRGLVQGMEDGPSGKTIRAEVPLSEMFGYATDLRSATQGRASYAMEFSRYMEAPSNIAEAIIKKG